MKKYLILLIFLLTGCFKDVAKGNLTNICTKTLKTENLSDTTIYEIKFKQDIISNIKLTKLYEGDSKIIESIISSTEYQNKLYNVKIESEKSEETYKIIYYLDNNSDDKLKEQFNLLEERSKQVKKLEELGFKCESA